MGVAERRSRERAEREERIRSVARSIAAREGWPAVTIRRLADEIEYSQPVIYAHYENRDAIVSAVATEGFDELGAALRAAAGAHKTDAGERVGHAYLAFAREHPAVYEAMFAMASGLKFAQADTKPQLRSAFDALAAVVPARGAAGETLTETFWAALHGLAELERCGRLRVSERDARLTLLVRALLHRAR